MNAPEVVLVVGSGAREHALAWRLSRDPGVRAVHVAPGNPGMADVAAVHPEVSLDDFGSLADLARHCDADGAGFANVARRGGADLVVVGPEAPLAVGLANRLTEEGLTVFGPTKPAATLEASKSFCRSVAEAAGIPMAEGAAFEDAEDAIRFARSLGAPVVVKADGLASGKGVRVCPTLEAAEVAIRASLDRGVFGAAGRRVVVERQLFGWEASLMAVCDETHAVALPAARDHKRIGDGDMGPNTGGMGAYSPLPDLDDAYADRLLDVFHRPALAEMAKRDRPFRGLLYAGLMLTADGPRLLEFNVRFGDPEAQAILPRLGGSFGALLLAAARGELSAYDHGASGISRPVVLPNAAVAVVLASAGYPVAPRSGEAITGIDEARASGALVFHAATSIRDGLAVSSGGRVLTVVGQGRDTAAAREQAYAAVTLVRFAGMQYRTDIGGPVRALAEVSA